MECMRSKVRNIEIACKLREFMNLNISAIDYIDNQINRTKDILGYNDKDKIAKEHLKVLKYINFALYFLDEQYMKAFKDVGGKI